MEIRSWEQRNSDMALHETNREHKSQRLERYQANLWADQAHREKFICADKLEMRQRLFQESGKLLCQEAEELLGICCEETDRARQAESKCHGCCKEEEMERHRLRTPKVKANGTGVISA